MSSKSPPARNAGPFRCRASASPGFRHRRRAADGWLSSVASCACSRSAVRSGYRESSDPDTDAVNGVFDYDGAAWADRHHDFRYLLFDSDREDMLDAALAVYEPAIGRSLDCARIRLYNAACAVSYLAFRVGTPPEQKSCGRTLAEDLQWVHAAITKLA
jgi:hypothetical protein